MRLIEAWNRRPLDDLSGVSSPGTVTDCPGRPAGGCLQ